jgi:hypothetical protein
MIKSKEKAVSQCIQTCNTIYRMLPRWPCFPWFLQAIEPTVNVGIDEMLLVIGRFCDSALSLSSLVMVFISYPYLLHAIVITNLSFHSCHLHKTSLEFKSAYWTWLLEGQYGSIRYNRSKRCGALRGC